jgi:hypothetical protein
MGMAQSPDWAQGAHEEVLEDLLIDYIECFINDIGAFTPKMDPTPWKSHLLLLDTVLTHLQENGFTVNLQKCHWAVQEAPWLSHWLTPECMKPVPNKIEGILQIAKPTTLCQLRGLIGMVNYYRDFWKRHSHLMAPLTSLTKMAPKTFKYHWTSLHADYFKKIRAMITQQVLLAYRDPNLPFNIKTDVSAYQLVLSSFKKPAIPLPFSLANSIMLNNSVSHLQQRSPLHLLSP